MQYKPKGQGKFVAYVCKELKEKKMGGGVTLENLKTRWNVYTKEFGMHRHHAPVWVIAAELRWSYFVQL